MLETHDVNTRETDLNVPEVPGDPDFTPVFVETCLRETFLNHVCNVGYEWYLSALCRHASHTNDDAHRTSKQELSSGAVYRAKTTDGGGRDVGRPRMRTPRPLLRQ